MKTINISVTEEQYRQVQTLTKTLGFANRSEFFRTLLRQRMQNTDSVRGKLREVGTHIQDQDIENAITWSRK